MSEIRMRRKEKIGKRDKKGERLRKIRNEGKTGRKEE